MQNLIMFALTGTSLTLALAVSTATADPRFPSYVNRNANGNLRYQQYYQGSNNSNYSWQSEMQYQQAFRMALQNRKSLLEFNREWRQKMDADREVLKQKRAEQHVETDERHFRDQPDASHMASGDALNYLLKQFGPNLATVDFKEVTLTAAELASVRLKTTDGITTASVNWTEDPAGRIRWPEELRLTELDRQRDAVEESLEKLRKLDQQGQPVETQLKRVEHDITLLRSQAGAVLRVEKHDEIGANASRVFLKNLQFRITQAGSSEKLQQLRLALHPEPKSAEELIQHIARYDLFFAPCDDPAASAYHTLHDRLAEVHRELQRPTPTLQAGK